MGFGPKPVNHIGSLDVHLLAGDSPENYHMYGVAPGSFRVLVWRNPSFVTRGVPYFQIHWDFYDGDPRELPHYLGWFTFYMIMEGVRDAVAPYRTAG